ncbi:6,7-dimethyl-8-ribityllumazine synthase [Candidatus Altiarchaeota archaeon]
MEKINIGIVVGEFNADITHMMLERAKAHASFLEAEVPYIFKVPGAYDVPFAVKKILEKKDIDAVVALGAVIEGDTQHDEVVAQHAARKMMDLSLEHGKPVSLGISGPGMTRAQGQSRIDEYARRSIESAVKLVKRSRELAASSKTPLTLG